VFCPLYVTGTRLNLTEQEIMDINATSPCTPIECKRMQRLGVAMQRGNAAGILGTIADDDFQLNFLYN